MEDEDRSKLIQGTESWQRGNQLFIITEKRYYWLLYFSHSQKEHLRSQSEKVFVGKYCDFFPPSNGYSI